MVTNAITNAVTNICQVCGIENSFLHGFAHLPLQNYFFATLIILLVFILISKYGASINIDTWFGKIKIPSMKKNNNTVNMCELCRINVTSLVSNVAELCYIINKIEQRNIKEQIRELDNQFFLENSWINNCHSKMVNEKIKLRIDLNESEMTKIAMKNNQILYYIWLIKRQEIYEFVKNIVMLNNFSTKNATELRYFVYEKSKILAASLESGSNLYPDWDDPELLFKRQEYVDVLMEKIKPRIEQTLHTILETCQVIQQKYNKELEDVENKKIKIVEEFKKSLPPKKKEEN